MTDHRRLPALLFITAAGWLLTSSCGGETVPRPPDEDSGTHADAAKLPSDAGAADALGLTDAVALADASDQGTSDADQGDATAGDPDASAADAGEADSGFTPADVGFRPDAGSVGQCEPSAIIDLNAAGTRVGNVTRYVGNNSAAPSDLPGPSCKDNVGHQVAFRYTPQSSVKLAISTNSSTTAFDTVLWALDLCAINGFELGCSDDQGVAPRRDASAFSTSAAVPAGTPIIIIVAGYGARASGRFELAVTELSQLSLGSPCSREELDAYCSPGVCLVGTATDTAGVCTLAPELKPSPNPPFVDACSAGTKITELVGSSDTRDDGRTSTSLPIPFTFRLGARTYNELWVVTNGFVSLGSDTPAILVGRNGFPNETMDAILAPFLQDLIVETSSTADLCYATVGAAPDRKFVVEWLGAQAYQAPSSRLTFEVILNETSNAIDFLYRELSADPSEATYVDGSRAVVGYQTPNAGVARTYPGTLTSSTALRFAP